MYYVADFNIDCRCLNSYPNERFKHLHRKGIFLPAWCFYARYFLFCL